MITAKNVEVKPASTVALSSISILLKESFSLYKIYIYKLLAMQLIPFLGAVFMSAAVALIVFFSSKSNVVIFIISIIIFLIMIVATIILGLMAQLGQFLILKYSDPTKDVVSLLKESWPLVGKFFLLNVLFFLIVFFGVIVLIIPGVYLAVIYSFANWVFVFEKKFSMAALKRSKELVKNYWWGVFWRGLAISLIFIAVVLVFSIPLNFTEEGSLFYVIWTFVARIFQFIITPIMTIYTYLIYQELVKIKGVNQIVQE